MEKKENSCRACTNSRIEYINDPYEDDEWYQPIHGIDYHYKCTLHDMIIKPDYLCPSFELPF